MLSINNIDNFTSRIKVSGANFRVINADPYGDYIKVFDSETDFSKFKDSILNCRAYYDNVLDNGLNFVAVKDYDFIDGNKVSFHVLCERGDLGYGTNIKMIVKSIEYYYDGEPKVFLSYESYKTFLDSLIVK